MSDLRKVLGVLGQPNVTELELIVGRPIVAIVNGKPKPLTSATLSMPGLLGLIEGSEIAAWIARNSEPDSTCQVDGAAYTLNPATGQGQFGFRIARSVGKRARRSSTKNRAGAESTPANVAPASQILTNQPPSKADSTIASSHAPSKAPEAPPPGLVATDDDGPGLEIDRGAVTGKANSHRAHLRADATPIAALGSAATALIQGGKTGLGTLLTEAIGKRASDVHVAAGQAVAMRVAGELQRDDSILTPEQAEGLLRATLTAEQQQVVLTRGYVDTAFDVPGGVRVRANISRQRLGWKGSFRIIPREVPTLASLRLPNDLAKITKYHQGLVVIAGPNGMGKTTTMAALIDLINAGTSHHVITVEDPIEFVHPVKKAVMSQRQVGAHTASFASALKAALREDPDVIVIGELRDRETVEIALTAAETGHLVLATMSTPSAGKTLDRLIDMFPSEEQAQVRVSLAGAIKFVVAQRLLRGADGASFHAAIELVTGVLPLSMLIRDNKLYQLPSLMQRGKAFGMIRLDESLLELARSGRVSHDVALTYAEARRDMQAALGAGPIAAAKPAPVPEPAKGAPDLKQRLGGIFGKKEQS